MKRDFERAYRELAQNESPDLWDRIEAGLSEKSTPVLTREQENKTEGVQNQKKMATLVSYRKYVTVAAALLCVAILIPVLGRNLTGKYGGYSASDTGAAENGGASAADTAAVQEAPAAEAAGGTLDATDAAASVQDDTASYMQSAQKAETAAEATMEMPEAESTADDMDAGTAESTMLQGNADSRSGEEKNTADKLMNDLVRLEEDEVISHVVIRVTDVRHTELAEDIDEVGMFYTFLVEEEPAGILAEGEQYVLFVPAWSSYAFIRDGAYEVDLGYREGEEYSFVLEGYYGEKK